MTLALIHDPALIAGPGSAIMEGFMRRNRAVDLCDIITDKDWIGPGHRPRPWHTYVNQQERDSRAALIDRRPELGFWLTLADAIRNHPRTWRVSVTITAGILLAQIGAML